MDKIFIVLTYKPQRKWKKFDVKRLEVSIR